MYRIARLDRDVMERRFDEFVDLDLRCFPLGWVWKKANFFIDMPGKWEMSCYVDIDGAVVGYAIVYSWTAGVAHLSRLAVAPEFRYRGYAQALVEMYERQAIALGFSQINLEFDLRLAATEFYSRVGYREMSPDMLKNYLAIKNNDESVSLYRPGSSERRTVFHKFLLSKAGRENPSRAR